jgi:hypothetical protein
MSSSPHPCSHLKRTCARTQADMTMAVDVLFSRFQTRWPWLTDEANVLAAVLAIFVPDEKYADDGAPPATVDPWLYVNVVLEHTQVCAPLHSGPVVTGGATAPVITVYQWS